MLGVHGAPPDGCSPSAWTTPCYFSLTCESLYEDNIYCSDMEGFGNCATVCADPCCAHTTTVTQTSNTVTMTSVTNTATTKTVTVTSISHTNTATTVTATSVTTTTLTTETATTVEPTRPAATTEQVATTEATSQSDSAIVISSSVNIEVNDAINYVQDDNVRRAYVAAFAEAAGLYASMIAVSLTFSNGTVTAAYTVTIPIVDGSPTMSEQQVQSQIEAVTPASFEQVLQAKVDELVGADVYQQRVLEPPDDVVASVARALGLPLVTLLCMAGQGA